MNNMADLEKNVNDTESFGIITYKDGENFIVLAEGSLSELSDIFSIIKELHEEKELVQIALNKEEYESKKQYINLLNSYLANKVG